MRINSLPDPIQSDLLCITTAIRLIPVRAGPCLLPSRSHSVTSSLQLNIIPMMLCTLLTTVLFAGSAFAGCYWPNGTLNPSPDYQPCNDIKGQYSMCCATNRASYADSCLPNGLCQNFISNGQNTGISLLFWRESCTDPSWTSPYCLGLCVDGSGGFDTSRIERSKR